MVEVKLVILTRVQIRNFSKGRLVARGFGDERPTDGECTRPHGEINLIDRTGENRRMTIGDPA